MPTLTFSGAISVTLLFQPSNLNGGSRAWQGQNGEPIAPDSAAR